MISFPRLGGQALGALRAAVALWGRPLRFHGGIVLTYHDIGTDPANTTDYYVSPGLFRRQLCWAREWGLRFVDLGEFSRMAVSGASVDGLAAVCFDDSLVGVHRHALPVLVELGVPATLFTVSAELGNDPPWWPGAARVMTRKEVGEWSAAGLAVGSHTRTHASLPDVAGAQLRDEVRGSRAELEDLTQSPVPTFAYPYGHFHPQSRQEVVEAGYLCAYSFLNGRVTADADPFSLPRLNMFPGQHRLRLAYHLARPDDSWHNHQLDTWRGTLRPVTRPGPYRPTPEFPQ